MTDRSAVTWRGDTIEIVDQTLLPQRLVISQLRSVADAIEAIRSLRVRGAPAIGVCGAFALVLGLQLESGSAEQTDRGSLHARASALAEQITSARPTAVNLPRAVGRVRDAALHGTTAAQVLALAEREALAVQRETSDACRRIGEFGRDELQGAPRLLTHCNTGWLATNGRGTALAIVYAKHERGESVDVLVSETRPLMQGARLTAWELHEAGIPVTLTTEAAAAAAMATRRVDAVVVGCDRVARNGDTANKVGTYAHAVVAAANSLPFYVAGPLSSFDRTIDSGDQIEIEERDPEEVRRLAGMVIAPPVHAWNPAFDITPWNLIAGFITEAGVLRPPFVDSIASALESAELVMAS